MAAELRIAFVIPILGCGGAEVLLCAVMEELHKRNYSIICICLHPHHYSIQNLPNREFVLNELKPLITNSSISSSFTKGLKSDITDYQRILEEFRPDIVHSHLYEAELFSRFYIYPGARYITHGHDNMPQFRKFDFKTLFNKRLLTNYLEYRWLCKRYVRTDSHFIAISKDVEQWFLTNLPSSLQKNVHLLPNGFNFNYYNQGSRIRKPEKCLRIVSVGNLVEKKNHKLLIDIAALLKSRKIDFTIDIFGFGVLLDALKEECVRLNVANEVIFHGSVGNIHERLKQADIYVHPATYEPFGLVLLEAMANGLPIIAMDGQGNRELIQDGINGYMIWKNNPELFAEKIIELVGSETKMQTMSEAAIKFSKEYSIEGYVSKLLDIYLKA
jgi:glycosyltransferase involved in cell wall biosynthesis